MTMNTRKALVGLLVAAGVGVVALAGSHTTVPAPAPPAAPVGAVSPSTPGVCRARGPLPDPACTPGVADPTKTAAVLCAPGYSTKSVRPPVEYTNALKRKQMAEYGFTGAPSDYEEDHLISLELGGSPTDPLNLWPEAYAPPPGAHEKDSVENALHKAVCAGVISLGEAQRRISGDWTAEYRMGLHPDP